MSLLAEAMEKMTKKVTLNIGIYEVNDEMIARLHGAVYEYKGNCPLSINLIDNLGRISVELPSRLRIDPARFTNWLKSLPEIGFTLS